jgi:uncharacterized protein
MTTKDPTDTATVIIGQKVHPESVRAFAVWQEDLNREASKFPGFIAAEINPPTEVQPEWVVIYRFDSIANVQTWMNSAIRQERMAAGQKFFDGPGTQQVLGGGARHEDSLVTVAVSHLVRPGDEKEFLAWQDRLRLAESRFPGFRGSELFRPVAGIQEEWTALYRYDTADDLDRWLLSDERKRLLAEGEKFSDFKSRTIENSFGSWFAFDERGHESPAPSETKTSFAVWAGLYPTVMIITLALRPLHMPLWLALLIGNLLSSFAMSFVTMPYYVNRLTKFWLRPAPDAPKARTNWLGIGTIVALNLFWAIVFYLATKVFWHVP